MRYVCLIFLVSVLSGCVFTQKDAAKSEKSLPYIGEIVLDAGAELELLYPPAKTRFILLAEDDFGNELLQVLRKSGYAINENRGNGITIGYVVDTRSDGDLLVKLYLGDDIMLSRLYRLNPPDRKKSCFPVGSWSRRQMITTESEGTK